MRNKVKALMEGSFLLLAFIFGFWLLTFNLSYGAPNWQLNYQAKLTNASGVAVADGDYDIVFNLYATAATTTSLWTEDHTAANDVTVADGRFTVQLGSITALTTVDFNQTLYLGVNVEGDGEMTPRKVLTAAPAAFQADELDNLDSTSFLRSDAADTMSAGSAGALLTVNQTSTGNIFVLQDGGSPVLTVLDGGNVGILDSSPTYALTVGSGDLFGVNSSGLVFIPDGSFGSPALTFTSDPDTGIYQDTDNKLSLAAGGQEILTLGASDEVKSTLPVRVSDGSVTIPSFSFDNDSNTGLYSIGADHLGITTGGTLRFSVATSTATSSVPFRVNANTNDDLFLVNQDNGDGNILVLKDSGTAVFTVTAGGDITTNRVVIDGTAASSSVPFWGLDGSASAPTFSFGSASTTGMYRSGATINLAAGGVQGISFNSTTSNTSLYVSTITTNNGLCKAADSGFVALRDCAGAPVDIAEWYETDGDVEVGDLVMLSPSTFSYEEELFDPWTGQAIYEGYEPGDEPEDVESWTPEQVSAARVKSRQTISVLTRAVNDDRPVLGVVSTSPYQVLGESARDAASHPQPIALIGRVPTKVSNEGGEIEIGDRIGPSTEPGVGKKAAPGEPAVGYALEPHDESGVGRIMVYVNLSQQIYNPAMLNVSPTELAGGQFFQTVKSINQVGANWWIDESGRLSAREVQTDRLCVGDYCVDEAGFRRLLQRAGLEEQTSDAPGTSDVEPEEETSDPEVEPPEEVQPQELDAESEEIPVIEAEAPLEVEPQESPDPAPEEPVVEPDLSDTAD